MQAQKWDIASLTHVQWGTNEKIKPENKEL